MSSFCPVCKNTINDDTVKCSVCNFTDLHREFISKEDAQEWLDTIVLPYREKWTMQKSIAIIGIGGAGVNTINRIKERVNAFCIVLDSDNEHIKNCSADISMLVNTPEAQSDVSNLDISELSGIISKYSIFIIFAGLGGQAGSVITPIVAYLLKQEGKTVIAITTKPFMFEGRIRLGRTQEARNALNEYADYQIMISNDEILRNVPGNISMAEGFKLVDDVVVRTVDVVEHTIESDNNNIVDTVKIELERNLSEYSILEQE